MIFVLFSFGFGTLCGCIDELVQAFSSRNPDILDVLLDTAGYLFSALTVYSIYFLFNLVLNLILRQKGKHRA
jgi:VanZ family protein